MAAVKFDPGTRFEVSVESPMGEVVLMVLFDCTVNMAVQVKQIFDSLETNPKYKKFDTVKIKRI